MPTVLLIRHAQASFGAEDYDVLSEQGRRQVAATYAAVGAHRRGSLRLVSGTLRRQRDTALPWAGGDDARLEVDARWNEYDTDDVLAAHSAARAALQRRRGDPGPALSSREFQRVLDGALEAWVAAGADGPAHESWPGFRDRVGSALGDLTEGLEKGRTAAVFTSAGVIAACCVLAAGLPDAAFPAFNRVAVNASVTKLVSGRRGTTLVSFNEHVHLESDGLVTYR